MLQGLDSFAGKLLHMKLVLFLFLIISLAAVGAMIVKNKSLVLGKTDVILSAILNEHRKILVYVPESVNEPATDTVKYPVLYLLDGDAHFAAVTENIKQLSEVNGNTACPKMIVVAVVNTDRARDLTPSHSMLGPEGQTIADFKTSGGSEKFVEFIEKELIPYVDATYPTLSFKILMGHSLSGLTVMHVLLHHTALFNAYVAIDPSAWWDNRKLLHEASEILKRKKFDGTSLFLGVANTIPEGLDIASVQHDNSNQSFHIRANLELAEILKSCPNNGLRWQYTYYPEHNHGSVFLKASYDALQFVFKS